MQTRRYEYVVVGSGMGGGTLASELARRGKDALVLESGKRETELGAGRDTLRFYDVSGLNPTPRHSVEGTIIWRTFMAGGSTAVSCGNGVRCLQSELAQLGIDLEEEFAEIEDELRVAPIDPTLLSDGSHALWSAADDLGYTFQRMPKFIQADKCQKCGNCVYGCKYGGRWTAVEKLDIYERAGGHVEYGVTVDRVLHENGRAVGVEAHRGKERLRVDAGTVILAAGGLGTPVILQASGVEAGKGLFVDPFVNTYAVTKGLNQMNEPTMALVDLEWHDERGFLLSPFQVSSRMVRLTELGRAALTTSPKNIVGLMTKVADERSGTVHADGTISKPITRVDQSKLDEGSARSREILVKAGGEAKSVMVSKVQGAHPGGTAAIGEVVDANLETGVSGLFVCDASVLPATPGLPPILTIGALSKYLAKRIAA